jgi:hypothetical protein
VTDQPKPVTVEAKPPSGFAGTVETKVNVKIELIRDGKVVEEREANTVTTAGKAGIADQILASPTLGKPTHMAVGTGTPSGTALGTENDRNALTSKTRSGAVVTMVGDWAAGDATAALTEAGIFDASSAGNMWTSVTFSVVNKGALDTLKITWTLTIA